MSAPAAEVFDHSLYEAPSADLQNHDDVAEPDRLFSAEGRVGVLRYNAVFTQSLLAICAGALIVFAAFKSDSQVLLAIAAIPGFLLLLGIMLLLVFTTIKRLHDIGRSGWFYLIGLIPLVGTLWVLYYALKPGSDDSNEYGARREATGRDRILGYIGIVLTVLVSIVALIPQG